jgi:hypothetical protein
MKGELIAEIRRLDGRIDGVERELSYRDRRPGTPRRA